ncbi:hypothetical protein QFC21_005289 [Naganishia friedmannii]|uniref:Uncharacterized protein n=1 Tax=Naganishia friedmannii TaxID=89922 RepID=A0ACC2VD24_9TREE|nr:hypothetical protein QFC21_005289 [Naganishia friedmannii]
MLKRVKRDLKQWRAARGKDTFSRNAEGEEAGATSWARILDAISVTTNNQQQPSQSAHWWDYLPFSATRQRNARQQQRQEPSRTTDGAYDPQVPEDPIQHAAESDPLMEWDGVGPVPTSSPPAPHGKPTTTAKPRGSPTSTAFSSSYWWSYFLDKRYLDARIHGIGMVLDFGLTRSEEDVRREVWEMVDWDERQRVPGGDIDVPDKETERAEDEAEDAEERESVSLSLEQSGSVEDGESLLSTSASFSEAQSDVPCVSWQLPKTPPPLPHANYIHKNV